MALSHCVSVREGLRYPEFKMIQESILSGVVAAVIAGGLSLAFRTPVPTVLQARGLLLAGLACVGAALAIVSGTLPGKGNNLVIVALASVIPGLLYILAGLGFRRYWHTGIGSFVILAALVFSGAIAQFVPPTAEGPSFWFGLVFKGAASLCLLHTLSSLWSGRQDDMDMSRLAARYPLALLVAVTLGVTLVSNQTSDPLNILLVFTWLIMAAVIYIIRIRNINLVLEDPDGKQGALRELFDRRRIYREDDLTLERIGDRLILDNRQVRHLIHRGLGFRRLDDLLDDYRIKAAQTILEDADQVETGIAEVAISVGYRSALPLEAAFERLVGERAQDYRRRHLEKANANRPLQLTNSDR